MGVPVLILGESGSGKSTSMRNFSIEEVAVLNVAGKPLPFRKKLNTINNATYQIIFNAVGRGKLKRYVIDDSQYLMAFDMFARAKETGYDKFTDMAMDFYSLIKFVIDRTAPDVIVYFLHHIQETDRGIKAKTIGKMLDEKLTVEGLFSVVLMAESENGNYYFRTQTNGNDTVKSPMEMFEDIRIDNDLKMVDQKIREYWGLDQIKNEREEKTNETNQ